jgi:transposase
MTDAMFEAMVETMHEGDAYRRVEVITGRRRSQDWPADEKARIVAESFQPGANISEVARRNGVNRGLLGVWRKQARAAVMAVAPAQLFATVQIEDVGAVQEASVRAARKAVGLRPGLIIVELSGAKVRVPNGVDPATLGVLIQALRGGS